MANMQVKDAAAVVKFIKALGVGTDLDPFIVQKAMQFIDQNGLAYGLKHIDNKLRTSSVSYFSDIAADKVPNHIVGVVHGSNPLVGLGSQDTLTPTGGQYVPPADAGEQLRFVSTSASDAAAGVGIQQVILHCLDDTFTPVDVVVTLNGITPVLSAEVNISRINGFHEDHGFVGANKAAVGTISVTNAAGTVIYGTIEPGSNQAELAFFTVPAGNKGFITGGICSATEKLADFRILTTTDDAGHHTGREVYHERFSVTLDKGSLPFKFDFMKKLAPMADVMLVGFMADTAGAISGTIEGFYEPV